MVYCRRTPTCVILCCMTGGSRIIPIGSSGDAQADVRSDETLVSPTASAAPDSAPLDLSAWTSDEEEAPSEASRRSLFDWLFPTLALLAIAGWTGFYAWANRASVTSNTTPTEGVALITGWTLPVLLVCVLWLIAMRSSTREAARFGTAARLLSTESAQLETRLLTVNRELSLAREFIAAQSRDLESLGRIASERLSANADLLQALVAENGDRVEAIGSVSAAALENMEKLRGQLPVIASSAKDLTNNIANAGRTAHGQVAELIRGFNRLNDFGQASEAQVLALRDHLNETLTGLGEQSRNLEAIAQARHAELSQQTADLRVQLERHEVDALAAIRTRASALAQELDDARIATTSAESEALAALASRIGSLRDEGAAVVATLRDGEAQALEAWTTAMASLEAEIAERSQTHARIAEQATSRAEVLTERLAAAHSGIEQIASDAQQWDERIGAALARLDAQMAEAKTRLSDTEQRVASLTEAGARLFELIHASAEQAGELLPQAIGKSDKALTQIETRASGLAASMRQIEQDSSTVAAKLDETRVSSGELATTLASKQEQIRTQASEHLATLEQLAQKLTSLDEQHQSLGGKAREQLSDAIAAMEGAARDTLTLIDTKGTAGIERITNEIRSRSAEAIGNAIHSAVAEIPGQLEQAAAHASGISREATIQLRDQLAKVHELVANLENRVTRARERAEEQVDNDFARRAALITESLNSNAIDIAKAFSAEVSDTAWQGYLKGDRGIFTRRALSLIEASDARSVLQIFERDQDFRELVSRYIHDFEAMLRQVLSTRDGKAMGVTLLSSDMGKLYVALAQAIERLRT